MSCEITPASRAAARHAATQPAAAASDSSFADLLAGDGASRPAPRADAARARREDHGAPSRHPDAADGRRSDRPHAAGREDRGPARPQAAEAATEAVGAVPASSLTPPPFVATLAAVPSAEPPAAPAPALAAPALAAPALAAPAAELAPASGAPAGLATATTPSPAAASTDAPLLAVPAPLAVAAALPASVPVAPAPAPAPAAAAIPAAPGDHAGVPAPTGADPLPAAPAPAAVPASALPAATPASGLPATPPEPSGAGFPAPATGAPSPTPAEAPTSAPSSAPVAEPAAAPAGGSAPQPAAGPAEPPAEQPGPAPAPTPPAADSRPSAGLESLLRQAAPARGFERAASLERAPRAVAQTIHIATQRGVSHARLNLRPSELGGVEIQLQASAGGVIAQVIADSPEAARALQAAAEDLRRALARQDVTLLSLEVSTSGGEQRDTQGARDGAPHAGAPRAGAGARGTGAVTTLDTHETAEAVIELPDGVLVDVLA